MNEVNQILSDFAHGDARAAGQLLPSVYDDLRRLGIARLAAEPAGNTLQPRQRGKPLTPLRRAVYSRTLSTQPI
jgi:ECF sigma factor